MSVDEIEVYRVLTSKSRLEIFRLLYAGPKGIKEIADRLSLGLFTVRYHMKALESVGLIERYEVKGRRGKPKAYYKVSDNPPILTFPKRQYQAFSDSMMNAFQKALGEENFKKVLFEMGRNMGKEALAAVAKEHGVREWDIASFKEYYVNRAVADSVGEPEVVDEGKDRLVYRIYNCPLLELANRYPEYVCSTIEEGQREGIMEATGRRLVVERPTCIAHGDRFCEFEVRIA
jgi:predicted ArsR family transcriptional regulator